jgi:hypothetical protein
MQRKLQKAATGQNSFQKRCRAFVPELSTASGPRPSRKIQMYVPSSAAKRTPRRIIPTAIPRRRPVESSVGCDAMFILFRTVIRQGHTHTGFVGDSKGPWDTSVYYCVINTWFGATGSFAPKVTSHLFSIRTDHGSEVCTTHYPNVFLKHLRAWHGHDYHPPRGYSGQGFAAV